MQYDVLLRAYASCIRSHQLEKVRLPFLSPRVSRFASPVALYARQQRIRQASADTLKRRARVVYPGW